MAEQLRKWLISDLSEEFWLKADWICSSDIEVWKQAQKTHGYDSNSPGSSNQTAESPNLDLKRYYRD